MPTLVKFSLTEALDICKAQDLGEVTQSFVQSSYMKGFVIEQWPLPGERISKGVNVVLVVSGGEAIVPELRGIPLTEAEKRIKQAGLLLGEVREYEVDDSKQDGIVTAQVPEMNEHVLPGALIDLDVGKYEWRQYTYPAELDVSAAEDGDIIRVTLVEPDGEEYEMYEMPKDNDTIIVDLLSETGGLKSYHLYINGELKKEVSVVLR